MCFDPMSEVDPDIEALPPDVRALPPKAYIAECDRHVRFVPIADSCTAAI